MTARPAASILPAMHRWLITALALLAGLATTAGLLWYADPARGGAAAYVVVRDVPAGAQVAGAVRIERVRLPDGVRTPLGPGSEAVLDSQVAAHDLVAGQLLSPGDLSAAGGDRRLVAVAVKQAPPVAAGDHVDLLLVSGTGDHVGVAPFALGLEVRAATASGLVVLASPRAAAGLVYAGATAQLVAVVAERPARGGQEPSVSSLEEAAAVVRR